MKIYIPERGCIQCYETYAHIKVRTGKTFFTKNPYVRVSWSENGRIMRNVEYYYYDTQQKCEEVVKNIYDQI